MKKILIVPGNYDDTSYYDAITALGFQCWCCDGFKERKSLVLEGNFTGVGYTYFPKKMDRLFDIIVKTCRDNKIDAILFDADIRVPWRLFIEPLREQLPDTKCYLWLIDAHILHDWESISDFGEYISFFDKIFSPDGSFVDRCILSGFTNVFWKLPGGYSNYFKPFGVEKRFDGCFVGSAYKYTDKWFGIQENLDRINMMRILTDEMPDKLFYFTGDEGFSRFGKNFAVPDVRSTRPIEIRMKCNQINNYSKIVLCNDAVNVRNFTSIRTVNTLFSGSLAMLRYNKGFEYIFENHKNVVWFNSADELKELVRFYTENNEAREEIALAGRKFAFDNNLTMFGHVKAILGDLL